MATCTTTTIMREKVIHIIGAGSGIGFLRVAQRVARGGCESCLCHRSNGQGLDRTASLHLPRSYFSTTTKRRMHTQKRFSESTSRRKRVRSDGKGRQITKQGPHPRNKFQGSYDMERLCEAFPPLSQHIIQPDYNGKSKHASYYLRRPTIQFADPDAVRALNTALLVADYGIRPNYSDIMSQDALVPPIPGRADYVHQVADILAEALDNEVPYGPSIRGFDVGTGASVIYPLIANSTYGWSMVGTDVNLPSIESACNIVEANKMQKVVDVRLQPSNRKIFDGVWGLDEEFDFVMCNPPFYTSLEAFRAENARKVKGLARANNNNNKSCGAVVQPASSRQKKAASSNNFGGLSCELWCDGGEVAFVKRMMEESKTYRGRCLWFTSLVSRRENVETIEKYLIQKKQRQALIADIRKVSMGAGIKSASIIMWSFMDEVERQRWVLGRWDE